MFVDPPPTGNKNLAVEKSAVLLRTDLDTVSNLPAMETYSRYYPVYQVLIINNYTVQILFFVRVIFSYHIF